VQKRGLLLTGNLGIDSIRLLPLLLSAVFVLSACNDLDDNRIASSDVPGIYGLGTGSLFVVPLSVPAQTEHDAIFFDELLITSTGKVVGSSGSLRIEGQLNPEFDPDGELIGGSGQFDAWHAPGAFDEAAYEKGPHATAEVLSAELDFVTVQGKGIEFVIKVVTFELDFTAVEGQQALPEDNDWNAYDGVYEVTAEDRDDPYLLSGDFERTAGFWEFYYSLPPIVIGPCEPGLFIEESECFGFGPVSAQSVDAQPVLIPIEPPEPTELYLAAMDVDSDGNFSGVIEAPPGAANDRCLDGEEAGRFVVEGFIAPFDVVNGKSPKRNAYEISGDGVCQTDENVSISFEGLGWLAPVPTDGQYVLPVANDNDELLDLYVRYVIDDGDKVAEWLGNWELQATEQTASLSIVNDSWSPGDEPAELRLQVSYEGDAVEGGFDVQVEFLERLSQSGPDCADAWDLSQTTLTCPAAPGDCEPVVIPLTPNNNHCSAYVGLDALPGFVIDDQIGQAVMYNELTVP